MHNKDHPHAAAQRLQGKGAQINCPNLLSKPSTAEDRSLSRDISTLLRFIKKKTYVNKWKREAYNEDENSRTKI